MDRFEEVLAEEYGEESPQELKDKEIARQRLDYLSCRTRWHGTIDGFEYEYTINHLDMCNDE